MPIKVADDSEILFEYFKNSIKKISLKDNKLGPFLIPKLNYQHVTPYVCNSKELDNQKSSSEAY